MISRKGKITIDLGTICFVAFLVIVVLYLLGKTSFWSIVLFPFAVVGGLMAFILGIVLFCAVILGVCILITWLIDKFS